MNRQQRRAAAARTPDLATAIARGEAHLEEFSTPTLVLARSVPGGVATMALPLFEARSRLPALAPMTAAAIDELIRAGADGVVLAFDGQGKVRAVGLERLPFNAKGGRA